LYDIVFVLVVLLTGGTVCVVAPFVGLSRIRQ
jgi:hypothetical protein